MNKTIRVTIEGCDPIDFPDWNNHHSYVTLYGHLSLGGDKPGPPKTVGDILARIEEYEGDREESSLDEVINSLEAHDAVIPAAVSVAPVSGPVESLTLYPGGDLAVTFNGMDTSIYDRSVIINEGEPGTFTLRGGGAVVDAPYLLVWFGKQESPVQATVEFHGDVNAFVKSAEFSLVPPTPGNFSSTVPKTICIAVEGVAGPIEVPNLNLADDNRTLYSALDSLPAKTVASVADAIARYPVYLTPGTPLSDAVHALAKLDQGAAVTVTLVDAPDDASKS